MNWKNLSSAVLINTYAEAGTKVSFGELLTHLSAREMIVAEYGVPGLKYQQQFCEVWEIKKEFPGLI